MILASGAGHGFGWEPHLDAWLLIAALLGGYVFALRRWGPRDAPGRPPATTRQWVYFLLGVASIEVAADWPVHQLADALFSVHMGQHLLLSLVSAPLLLLGTPSWLLRRLLSPAPVRAVWRAISQPLPALLLFNLWIAVYHVPALVNLSVTSDAFHLVVHVVWVVASVLMWWPVLSPLPELPHLSYPARMVYLFAQSLVPTVPASFLTFGRTVLYRSYAEAPLAVGVDPLTDQQVAGLLMKVGGGFFIWACIALLFLRWSHEEQSGGPDVLYWRDLEADLKRVSTPT
ncbi:MAG: cytochrome c oxidase assembly protein [Actinomycetota bacterium]|nr:cytochrome c oxidase assembly protein [Actinomycetota bacterium]